MASVTTFIVGFSAIGILLSGYTTAFGCFRRYKKDNAKLLLWAAIFLACMGSFYLGTSLSFISLLITDTNLPASIVGQLCYTWAPIGVGISMYIGFTLYKPRLAKVSAWIYILSGLIYWYGLYFMSNEMIGYEIPEGGLGLIDIMLQGFVRILTTVYLLTFGLIQIIGFSWLWKNSTGLIRKKARYQVIGTALFVLCGALDSMGDFPNAINILIVRLFMMGAYLFFYLGFTRRN
jgi:hypothetical protein